MGLLDDILSGSPSFGASPAFSNLANPAAWGTLNQPSPLTDEDAKRKAAAADMLASMGVSPTNLPEQPSPFPPPQQPAAPPPTGFGAGATPFGFAGPGSMTGISPAMMAPPAAPAAPPPAPVAAAPAAPPVVASDQASPIAVGSNYQMPRVGSADDFAPDDEETPAKAQPTQGIGVPGAPPAGPAPFSLGGAGASIGDRLMKGTKGFLGNLQNGPIGAVAGGLGALITGNSTDPGSIAAEQSNMTARALLAKNVDPQVVQAAIHNPDLMKTLIAQNFGPDKFQHVNVKNPDGSESPQAFDPSTGKYSGAAPQAPNKFSVDPNLTGKDRLDAIRAVDPLYAKKLEAMIAGDIPMPTGVAALRPDAKRSVEDALSIDGSLSASDFATRAATRKDYASGIASRVTKSINTTIGHFATLDGAVDKLGNYSYFPKISNAVHDAYSSNMDPNYQKAKATFETNKEAAVKELDFALSGGHSSVSGSAELRDKFNRADSPEALHAAITEAMSLLQKRLESHTKAFTEGTKSQRDPQDFIYPENQQAFSRMLGGQAPGAQAGPPIPQGAPKPGNYVWTPTGGLVGAK